MRVRTQDLFTHCYGTYAIPAINVEFMEQVLAVFAAADQAQAPIIVQTTPMAREYAQAAMMVHMIAAAEELYPEVVFALHLDHGEESHIEAALKSGAYTSVMIDASHDILEDNISRTQAVVEKAHANFVSVEAELGVLAGVEDDLNIEDDQARYTQAHEVEYFVEATGCDSLAIAIGTSHGAYKFSGGQGLQFGILKEIQKRLPGFPLVLHGASQVDPADIVEINAYGGKLQPSAKGVSQQEIQRAIPLGICKINLATDFRLLWTRTLRKHLAENPSDFAPIPPGKKYQERMKERVMEKCALFNAKGQSPSFLSHYQAKTSSR